MVAGDGKGTMKTVSSGETQGSGALRWWQTAVVYEIAPISFQDSNGDGKGDLPGLLARLDYLDWLGIDAIWLTPIFRSPFRDFGYDISDFCSIDPVYGTLDDFDAVVAQLHARGMRLILDFVPNHTASDHAWFEESRSSRTNPKADWYIWADPAENGGPPNNWRSRFGGSAWAWCEPRGQYYYHSFLSEQPDLNWRNRHVQSALCEAMRFWLRRGVDGFRIDACAVLIKDELLRDNPPDPAAGSHTPPPQRFKPIFTDDRPEAMACIERLRATIDEFEDRVLAGEVQGKTDRIGHFYDGPQPRLHLPLNFALLDTHWEALALQAAIDAYLNAVPQRGWPDWVIGGHDKKRVASRIGQRRSRTLAMLLLTLPGTPFLFAGDEIGMEQVDIPAACIHDPFEKLVGGYGLGRDPERSPMPWTAERHGGFSSASPWLPMGDVETRNVARQRDDLSSLLSLYRSLIAVRRREPALRQGSYRPARCRHDVLSYGRQLDDDEFIIGLNLADEPRNWDGFGSGAVVLSTEVDRPQQQAAAQLLLRPNEGVIVKRERH